MAFQTEFYIYGKIYTEMRFHIFISKLVIHNENLFNNNSSFLTFLIKSFILTQQIIQFKNLICLQNAIQQLTHLNEIRFQLTVI